MFLNSILKYKFFNDSSSLILSDLIKVVLTLITGLVAAKVLGPVALGVTAACALVFRFGPLLNIGILAAMGQEVTRLIGNNKSDEADDVLNISLSGIIVIFIIASLITTFFSLTKLSDINLLVGIFLNIIGLFFFQVYNILEARAKFNFRINTVAISQIICSVTNFIITISLIKSIGVYAVFLASLFSYLPSLIYLMIYKKEKISFKWNFKKVSNLVRYGFSIYFGGSCILLAMSIDRVFILADIGIDNLGIYTATSSLALIIAFIPMKLANFMYQYLRDAYVKNYSIRKLWSHLSLLISLTIVLCLPIIIIMNDIVIFLFNTFLESYVTGIELVKFFMLAVLSSILYHFCWSFLMAIDKKEYILYPQLFTLFISLFIYFSVYIFYDASLKTYALAFFLINLSSGLFMIFSILKLLISERNLDISTYIRILSVIIFAAFIVLIFPNFFITDVGISQNIIFLILRICTCFIIFIMIIFIALKSESLKKMSNFLNRET